MRKFIFVSLILNLIAFSLLPADVSAQTSQEAIVRLMKGVHEREIAAGYYPHFTTWRRYTEETGSAYDDVQSDPPESWLNGYPLRVTYLYQVRDAIARLVSHFYKYDEADLPLLFSEWEVETFPVEDLAEAIQKMAETLNNLVWLKLSLRELDYWSYSRNEWRGVYVYRDYYFAPSESKYGSSPYRCQVQLTLPSGRLADIKMILHWGYWEYRQTWNGEWVMKESSFYNSAYFTREHEHPTAYPQLYDVSVKIDYHPGDIPATPPGENVWGTSLTSTSEIWERSPYYYWDHTHWRGIRGWYDTATGEVYHTETESSSGQHWDWLSKTFYSMVDIGGVEETFWLTSYIDPGRDVLNPLYHAAAAAAQATFDEWPYGYGWYAGAWSIIIPRIAANVDFQYPGPVAVGEEEEWCGDSCFYPTITIGSTVNLANGNLFDSISIASSTGSGLSTNLTLYYNSLINYNGPCGQNWIHNYNINLTEQGGAITEMDEDGTRIKFIDPESDGIYEPEPRFGDHSTIAKNPDGSYSLTRKYGTKHYFNTEGKLTQIKDRNGNTQTLTYTDGNLAEITDSIGRVTTLTYDIDNKLISVSDPAHQTTGFSYDPNGNLIEIKDPAGNTTSYACDENHRFLSKTDPEGNTYRYGYNDDGKLISATDPGNNETAIIYDSENEQATVTDPLGGETTVAYNRELNVWEEIIDPLGNINSKEWDGARNNTTSTDANDNTTTNTYDNRGNLLSTTDAQENATSYTYNGLNEITTTTDPLGKVTTYEYDEKGNRTRTTDALNQVTRHEYDEKGKLTATVDSLGSRTEHSYDKHGNLASTKDPLGNITQYSYDATGNMLASADPKGNTTIYEYNNLNQLTATTDAEGNKTTYTYDRNGNRTKVTDPKGNTTQYEYDNQNRLIRAIDSQGNITQYTYDANDNRTKTIDPAGNTTTYGYDKANRLLTTTDPQGSTTSYAYDPAGNRTRVTDPEGNKTIYTYDSVSQISQITDAQGNTTSYSYDEKGRKTHVQDSRGTTSYTYDALDRVTEITDPLHQTTSYTYDAVGNRTSLTDAQGRTTRYEYDPLGQIVSTTDPQGNKTQFEYDSTGNRTAVIDSQGNRTGYEYDSLNRLIATVNPQGGRTTYEYDSAGNRVSVTDPEGRTTRYEYDENNRVLALIDPQGNRTQYQYDARGNRTSITDPLGRTTRYEYNSLSQLTAIIDPTGARTEYTYDTRGNLASKTDPNGATIRYEYNSLNQLTRRTYPDGYTDTWTYDAQGNELTKDSPSVHIENTYDSLNRLISRSVSTKVNGRVLPAKTISYVYDNIGNRTKMTDPLGGVTNYTYDERNQLISLSNPGNLTTTFTYDSLGRRLTVTYPNGTFTTYAYDEQGRLISLVNHGLGGELISSHSYEHDKAGNRTKEIEPYRVTEYTYDERDQLASANITGKDNYSFSYSYDKVGNRLSMEIAGGKREALPFGEYSPTLDEQPHLKHPVVINYDYNDADQLLSEVATRDVPQKGKGGNRAWEVSYHYDNNGNLIQKDLLKGNNGKDLKSTSYEYDYNNMLTRIVYPDGEENIFKNCTCGTKRVYKKDSAGITTYFFDEAGGIEHILFEYDELGNIKARYTLGSRVDEIISKKVYMDEDGQLLEKSKVIYYHYDALGSVVALTDERGKVVAEYDYSPFGRIIDWKGGEAKKNAFTYTGREYDRDSGLYFYRARYYDSRMGRFGQVDPIIRQPLLLALTYQHPYVYCFNNPVIYADPLGEIPTVRYRVIYKDHGFLHKDYYYYHYLVFSEESHRTEIRERSWNGGNNMAFMYSPSAPAIFNTEIEDIEKERDALNKIGCCPVKIIHKATEETMKVKVRDFDYVTLISHGNATKAAIFPDGTTILKADYDPDRYKFVSCGDINIVFDQAYVQAKSSVVEQHKKCREAFGDTGNEGTVYVQAGPHYDLFVTPWAPQNYIDNNHVWFP